MANTVNAQIVDAIEVANKFVVQQGTSVPSETVEAQVKLSLGLAVADATDYMRNVNAICMAATGVALKVLLEGDPTKATAATTALTQAQSAVEKATVNLTTVGTSVQTVLKAWVIGG